MFDSWVERWLLTNCLPSNFYHQFPSRLELTKGIKQHCCVMDKWPRSQIFLNFYLWYLEEGAIQEYESQYWVFDLFQLIYTNVHYKKTKWLLHYYWASLINYYDTAENNLIFNAIVLYLGVLTKATFDDSHYLASSADILSLGILCNISFISWTSFKYFLIQNCKSTNILNSSISFLYNRLLKLVWGIILRNLESTISQALQIIALYQAASTASLIYIIQLLQQYLWNNLHTASSF